MDAEDVALEALGRGSVHEAIRSSFGPGEAKALALDAHDDVAGVLVIRRRRDDAWIIDVARFLDEDGAWTGVGCGGGTYGDLPLDQDPEATPSLGPLVTSCSFLEDRGVATAGGFVIGVVDAVELAIGDRTRRVRVAPGSSAFVVAVAAHEADDLDAWMSAPWVGVASSSIAPRPGRRNATLNCQASPFPKLSNFPTEAR